MENNDTVLLKDAVNEIKQLRQRNAHMNARLTMFDDMMLLLNSGLNRGSMGMAEDIVGKIEKALWERENAPAQQ